MFNCNSWEHLKVLKCQVLIKRTLLEHMTPFLTPLAGLLDTSYWTERMLNVFWCVLILNVSVLILNASVLNVWMLTFKIRTLTFKIRTHQNTLNMRLVQKDASKKHARGVKNGVMCSSSVLFINTCSSSVLFINTWHFNTFKCSQTVMIEHYALNMS